MSRRRRAVCALLAVFGAVLVGHGLYIPAKALVAQVLLERAWQRARAGDDDVRPWPWADTAPVARLRAPRLDVETIALAGASGRTLAFGPGHVSGTALPGEPGNIGLAGHRDTHFAFLEDVQPGDVLELEAPAGGVTRYRVEHTFVADESSVWVLAPTSDDTLTLITCWPFDAVVPGGPERYIVRARSIGDAAPPAGQRERELVAER